MVSLAEVYTYVYIIPHKYIVLEVFPICVLRPPLPGRWFLRECVKANCWFVVNPEHAGLQAVTGSFPSTKPLEMAYRVNPATSWMFNLFMTCWRCFSTVLMLMVNSMAISLFEKPSAMSCNTSASREVNSLGFREGAPLLKASRH